MLRSFAIFFKEFNASACMQDLIVELNRIPFEDKTLTAAIFVRLSMFYDISYVVFKGLVCFKP